MNIIIFSKDRACQLDLLLRSIYRYVELPFKIWIIYNYSDMEFGKGYFKLHSKYNGIEWMKENGSFKSLLVEITKKAKDKLWMFLCDDTVLKGSITPYDMPFNALTKMDDVIGINLCIGININWSYERQKKAVHPGSQIYEWEKADILYDYPMGVSAHIFRTKDIVPILRKFDYDKAWNVESAMARHPINKPYVVMYQYSRAVSIPHNQVSGVASNKSEEGSVKKLNDRFLKGERIKLEDIDNNSIMFPVEFHFERMV